MKAFGANSLAAKAVFREAHPELFKNEQKVERVATSTRVDWKVLARARTGDQIHSSLNGVGHSTCGCRVTGEVKLREGQIARNLCEKCFPDAREMSYADYVRYSRKRKLTWYSDRTMDVEEVDG